LIGRFKDSDNILYVMRRVPLSKVQLTASIEVGERFEYTFFWGHQKSKEGSISKSCFSQWWVASFCVDGITFPTAEHYMMYRKALLFGDTGSAQSIIAAQSPKEVKALGRKVSGYDEASWLLHREEIVYTGNLNKFSQNESLRQFLLSTRDSILVEASPVDAIWGIGLDENAPDARIPERWPGLNLLGFALVRVREFLNNNNSNV
jgi:ribA/ribD-fused uncharacterized protein